MIGAAIKKDVWLLLRDRGALVSLFVLPLIFIVAFGSMFKFGSDSGRPRPIAVWYASGDARGDKIERLLGATVGFAATRAASASAARQAVANTRVDAALVIPATGPVEIVIDLAAPVQVRGAIQGALTSVVMRSMAFPTENLAPMIDIKSPPGIAAPLRATISSFQVAVPGNAVLFGFFIALTTAMSFVTERRTGTWRRLLAAPVPRPKALLATLVPYYVVGLVQLAVLFGIGAAAFGMHVAGSLVALVVLSMCVTLCAVCLGLLFGALASSEKQLGGIGSVVLLVMGLLGGCMVPRLVMPPFMREIGNLVPHSWALDGYYDVLVRAGTGIVDIAPAIGALLGFAAVFATLGIWQFRFER